jgi:cysteine-rich repeat protein
MLDMSINDVVVGSIAARPPADCPTLPIEVRFTDSAVLALVDLTACNTFAVDLRSGNGRIRLGYVEVVVETVDGALNVCAFDGTPSNPAPTCAARSLCGSPGASTAVTSVVGRLGCPTCGNGIVDAGEGCDDGNVIGGDGCSAECALEDLDHDGVLDLDDDCLATRIPEGVPTGHLNNDRYAIVSGTRNHAGYVMFDTAVRSRLNATDALTTQDTRGCSCEQILEVLRQRSGDDQRTGCSRDTIRRWLDY